MTGCKDDSLLALSDTDSDDGHGGRALHHGAESAKVEAFRFPSIFRSGLLEGHLSGKKNYVIFS